MIWRLTKKNFFGLKSDGSFRQYGSICQDYNVGVKMERTLNNTRSTGVMIINWQETGKEELQDRLRSMVMKTVHFALTTASESLN